MTIDSQPKPPKGMGPLAKREMRFAYMLLLPTFLIVLSVVLFPLVANVVDERCTLDGSKLLCKLGDYEAGQREDVLVRVSATEAYLAAPENIKDTKAGFDFVPENILTNSDFTLDNMGLFAAQLMNIAFRGRSFLRGLFLSPYVAPVIAVALAWVLLLDPGPGGTLNALLIQLGVIEGPISFLGQRAAEINILGLTFDFPIALTVVIIFEIWRYFPLAMLFILARMQSMSSDIYEAAEIDGATPIQQFRFISLPQLMGIIAVLFLLRFIWTFNKFDDIFLLTGGAAGTRTLTVNVYEQAFAVSNLGAGAAVAVVVFLVLLFFSVIFFKFSPEDDA